MDEPSPASAPPSRDGRPTSQTGGESRSLNQTGGTESPRVLGCLVCRSRKVRCDRKAPECRNCTRLGVRCPGYDADGNAASRDELLKSASDIFRASGVQKRRAGACNECRNTKSKCTKARPSCHKCLEKGIHCVYPTKYRGNPMPEPAALEISPPPAPTPVPNRHVQRQELDGGHPHPEDLYSETLPADITLRGRLINAYFDRVHHLGCLAFIHKPSFMRSFDCGHVLQDYGEPLVYVMCALGARYTFETSRPTAGIGSLRVGDRWADMARREVLAELHYPTTQNLMTMLLLCEHARKANQHALLFTLVGCVFRALRLLGLDAESLTDSLSVTAAPLDRQIKDRIVWATYAVDSFVASGVNQNSVWRADIPPLPLPWADSEFLTQSPAAPTYLSQVFQSEPFDMIKSLDIPALTVVLARLRGEVLRLIRSEPTADTDIQNPSSIFMTLVKQLELFYRNLPDFFRLTDLNIYILRDRNLLGAVFGMHFMYHAVNFDLLRISLAGFNFPLASTFRNVSSDFSSECQERCRYHANQVSELIQRGFEQGEKRGAGRGFDAFDDPACEPIAFESAKIQIIYTAIVCGDSQSTQLTRHNLAACFRLLTYLQAGSKQQSSYIRTLIPLCTAFGFADVVNEWHGNQSTMTSMPAEVTGSADINHLSNAAPFRLAQSEVEARMSTTSPQTAPTPGSAGSAYPEQPLLHANPAANASGQGPGQSAQFPIFSPISPYFGDNTATLQPGDVQQQPAGSADGMVLPTQNYARPMTDEYIRMADEMSSFLTWDHSDLAALPPWQRWSAG